MIPLRDDQPRSTIPYLTYLIIAGNLLVFGYELSLGVHDRRLLHDFIYQFGVIPHHFELALSGYSQFTIPGVLLTIVTSMFVHASLLHVLGNMWVLWIFGDNIEDHLGHFVYLIFYFFCGLIACLTQIYANPGSDIPSVGASGAIAGVMGAYLLRYPGARVQIVVPTSMIQFNAVWIPAWSALAYWILLQFFGTVWTQELAARKVPHAGGIAYWAHVGGFVAGLLLIKLLPGHTRYSYGGWVAKDGKEVPPEN